MVKMEKTIKKLFVVFGLIVLIKILLNLFIKSPSAFSDAYFYSLSAKSFIIGNWSGFFLYYPPLYSFLISWSYLFNNSAVSYFLVKLTNSIISSLIIFPAYFLAKEYLKEKRTAFYTAVIITLLPSNFSYSAFIMSENIFYTLFLTTLYFIYKAFKSDNKWFLLLSGIFIPLCIATRIIGLSLIPILILYALIEKKYRILGIISMISLILLFPYYMIKNSLFYGYGGVLYRAEEGHVKLLETFFWIILYPFFIYLQSFIVFANSAFKNIKIKFRESSLFRLFVFSVFFVLIMAIYHAIASRMGLLQDFNWDISGRPIGRYIACVLPLVIIGGIRNLRKYKISYWLVIPFSLLMLFPLLPPNNINITWLGIFTYFLRNQTWILQIGVNLLIGLFVIFLFNYLMKHIALKRVILLLFILNLMILGVIAYNANKYYLERDDTQAGIYLNEIAPDSLIIIDEEGCTERFTKGSKTLCDKNNNMSLVGMWNKNVIVGALKQGDYFVSKQELCLKKIKQFGEINIYET